MAKLGKYSPAGDDSLPGFPDSIAVGYAVHGDHIAAFNDDASGIGGKIIVNIRIVDQKITGIVSNRVFVRI